MTTQFLVCKLNQQDILVTVLLLDGPMMACHNFGISDHRRYENRPSRRFSAQRCEIRPELMGR